jgi:regulator of protease activity HflC (stomatin/prohibitin superfamily)
MIRRMIVGDNERMVVTRKGRFKSILGPGVYWMFGLGVEAESHDTRDPLVITEWRDFIVAQSPEIAEKQFIVVETDDTEVAVVYFDGKLTRVIGPGQRVLYRRALIEVTFEQIDVAAEPVVPT